MHYYEIDFKIADGLEESLVFENEVGLNTKQEVIDRAFELELIDAEWVDYVTSVRTISQVRFLEVLGKI